jgi:hypothetical protein
MMPEVDYPDHITFHMVFNGPKVHVAIRERDTDGDEDEDMDEDDDENE